MTTAGHEIELFRAAAARYGLVSRDDALAQGLSARTVRRRIRSGEWQEVVPGLYVPYGVALTRELREVAAIRWLGKQEARLSHLSAARWFGWPVPDDERAWVSVPHGPRPVDVPGLVIHRTRRLPPAVVRDDLPLTPPARTVSDLGQILERPALRVLFAEAVRRGDTSVDRVLHAADRVHHKAGTGLVREVAKELAPEFESFLELRLGEGFTARGLTWWQPQCPVYDRDGRLVARGDFGDNVSRTLIETDGFAYHGSPAQQARDKARDRKLARIGGWLTLRYGAVDVLEHLDETIDEAEAIRTARLAA